MLEVDCYLSLSFRLHRFFTADDITGIDAPAHLIHSYTKTAHATFISFALLGTFLGNLLYCFLLNHGFLLQIENKSQ